MLQAPFSLNLHYWPRYFEAVIVPANQQSERYFLEPTRTCDTRILYYNEAVFAAAATRPYATITVSTCSFFCFAPITDMSVYNCLSASASQLEFQGRQEFGIWVFWYKARLKILLKNGQAEVRYFIRYSS